MPPLNEGTILFMPTAVPGMSIGEATKILQIQDRLLRQIAEVDTVFGKAGQAETPTDPAPLSMFETVVTLKPPEQWRAGADLAIGRYRVQNRAAFHSQRERAACRVRYRGHHDERHRGLCARRFAMHRRAG